MIEVALGESDIDRDAVAQFDRTVAAQVDYPGAWSELLPGLRPRWYGSHEAHARTGHHRR